MALATILVSTHAERPTLDLALRSALQQSVDDLEICVIGDGCPDSSRRIVARLADRDSRLRFFDFPKGARNGEAHRDKVLKNSKATVVTYLSDDDLLFPDAVAVAQKCLEHATFMAPRACFVMGDGTPKLYNGDVASSHWRDVLQTAKRNFIPMTGTAHTMAFYRQLAEGWSPAPTDLWCDLFMWRKMMRHPSFVGVMAPHPTSIILPAPYRTTMTPDARATELATWFALLTDDVARTRLDRRLLAERADAASEHSSQNEQTAAKLRDANTRMTQATHDFEASLRTNTARLAEALDELQAERDAVARLAAENDTTARMAAGVREELERLRASLTWRFRSRLYGQAWIREPFLLAKRLVKR